MLRFEKRRAVSKDRLGSVRNLGRKFRAVDIGDRHREQLVSAVSEALTSFSVGVEESTVEIPDENGVVGKVNQVPESFFRTSKGEIRLAFASHVSLDGDVVDEVADRVEDR